MDEHKGPEHDKAEHGHGKHGKHDKGAVAVAIKADDQRSMDEWAGLAGLKPRSELPVWEPKPPAIGGGVPDHSLPEVPEEPEAPAVSVPAKEFARLKAVEAAFQVMNATATSGQPVPLTGYAGPDPQQYIRAKSVADAAMAAKPERTPPEGEAPPAEPPPAEPKLPSGAVAESWVRPQAGAITTGRR